MPPIWAASFLILWNSVAEYLIVTHGILINAAAIAGVSLNGIDNSVLNLLYNARVVGLTVLRS